MTKKRIKLVGDFWTTSGMKDFGFKTGDVIEVDSIDLERRRFVFRDREWTIINDIYEIEILPDEPEQENPAKETAEVETLTRKIERLEQKVEVMNRLIVQILGRL